MHTEDNTDKIQATQTDASSEKHHSTAYKVAKGIAWTLGGLVMLIIVAVVGVSLWLTPGRISGIIDREANKYLDAKLYTGNVSYTLWSTFPNITIHTDSLNIVSHSLSKATADELKALPANPDFLASTGGVSVSLNFWKALKGDVVINGISVERPRVNIVIVNDSVNNFTIAPKDMKAPENIAITIKDVKIGYPANIAFFNLKPATEMNASITDAFFKTLENPDNRYSLKLSTIVTGKYGDIALPCPIPAELEGEFTLIQKPFKLDTEDFRINVGDIAANISCELSADKVLTINSLKAIVSTPDVRQTIKYLPEGMLPSGVNLSQILDNVERLPLEVAVDLASPYRPASKEIPALAVGLNISDAAGKIPLPGIAPVSIKDLMVNASLMLTRGAGPDSRLMLNDCSLTASDGISISLTGTLDSVLSKNPNVNADLICNADLSKLDSSILPSSTMKVDGTLSGNTHIDCKLSELSNVSLEKMKLQGEFKTDRLTIKDNSSKLNTSVSGLMLAYDVKAAKNGAGASGNITVQADGLESGTIKNRIAISGLDLSMKGALRTMPYSAPAYTTAPSSINDSILSAEISHTPLYLTPALPSMLQTALSLVDISADIKVDKGVLKTAAYPAANSFSRLHISTNEDSLSIHSLNIATGSTRASLSGNVTNLRPFLLASSPEQLNINLDADFSDVDINRLAGTYYRGQAALTGKRPDYTVPPLGKMTAADSLCVAIPRNINAHIALRSKKAEYMQYTFSPLSTIITMHDGVAKIGDLSIGSPFCNVNLDWTYATNDLQNIGMEINLDLENFSFKDFMKQFPQLKASAPELEAISGDLSAKVDGSFLMYPSMFVNTPSMQARVSLHGDSVEISRNMEKLKKITNMMLIKGDDPISVKGLDIHASFHDNLLRLDPFTLDAGGYKVLIGGANNLHGQMYYHAGLLGSPFHMPFGVNIEGYYRHPSIRFGGRWIKDSKEQEIEADLNDDVNVNIMRQLRHGWLEFVAIAAKYDATNNLGAVSYVSK